MGQPFVRCLEGHVGLGRRRRPCHLRCGGGGGDNGSTLCAGDCFHKGVIALAEAL